MKTSPNLDVLSITNRMSRGWIPGILIFGTRTSANNLAAIRLFITRTYSRKEKRISGSLIKWVVTSCLFLSFLNPLIAQQRFSDSQDFKKFDLSSDRIPESEFARLGLDVDQTRSIVEDPLGPPDPNLYVIMPSDEWLLTNMANLGGGGANAGFNPSTNYQSLGDQEYPYAPLTSMSEVAELFDPPDSVTKLFLNFEGSTEYGVSPFVANSDDRERDIQEIMYYVAQTFSPFNVHVARFVGNGQMAESGGHTTIFIGDKIGNSNFWENNDGSWIDNIKRAYADGDYPCPNRAVNHQPNSDLYNKGFVDPIAAEYLNGVEQYWDSNSNDRIARSICHEAGHTFGLAHVLSNFDPDIMSYSASNKRSIYSEYELTALNSQPNGPAVEDNGWRAKWYFEQVTGFGESQFVANNLMTQNSYRVLAATLGLRQVGIDASNIANPELVHEGVFDDGFRLSISKDLPLQSSISTFGDYDVVDIWPETTEYLRVKAKSVDDPVWFDPILMVFDDNGTELLAYDNNSGDGKDAEVVFYAELGERYQVVIGALSNNTFGDYHVSVERAEFELNPYVFQPGDPEKSANPDVQPNQPNLPIGF